MPGLREEQRAELEDIISFFDKVGDGKIPADQVANALRCLKLNPLASDVEKYERRGGRISVDEFWHDYQDLAGRKPLVIEDYIEGLKAFDREGNGTLDSAQLQHVLCNLGDCMTMEDAEKIVSLKDEKGEVDYASLLKYLMAEGEEKNK